MRPEINAAPVVLRGIIPSLDNANQLRKLAKLHHTHKEIKCLPPGLAVATQGIRHD